MSDTPVPHCFEDANEDDLSFSDLPLSPADRPGGFFPSGPAHPPTSLLCDASDFEFSTGPAISDVDAFLFCGRSIPYDEPHQCRGDSRLLHSDSFGLRDLANRSFASGHLLRSNSLLGAKRSSGSVAPTVARARSSSSWRRHRALIGITKIPAKMELSDIRKRQGRRAPAPLFPVAEGTKEVLDGGSSGCRWNLLRPLRCGPHLGNASTKAFLGCFPLA